MTEPVLVVGAGPVGMTLALELARYDVDVVVVDRKPHLERRGSRAIVVARHALETFARLGCAEPMLAKAVAIARARTFFRETELFCVEFPPTQPGEIPLFVNLQQTYTEQTLYEHVAGQAEVRWSTEAVRLEQRADGVRLRVRTPRGEETLRGSFVVGCDGGGSAVRKLAGIEFDGRTFHDRFLIADIRAELPFPNERRFYFDPPVNPGRQMLIHQQPDDEWRLDWQVPADTDAEQERASGRLDRRIRDVIGDAPYELAWLSSYRFHERIARRFRAGRVFLAGDAAHLMAPFGARGMNSGIEDARNLGWKLAFMLAGEAPERLLGTYEGERVPAARDNVRITSATMRFMAPPTPLHRALRNLILRGSLPFAPLRRFVDSGKLATPAVYGGGAGLVGRLAPSDAVQRRLGRTFTLLCFCRTAEEQQRAAAAARAARIDLQTVRPDEDRAPGPGSDPLTNALAREYGVNGAGAAFLVRPDGYVAAEFAEVDAEHVRATVSAELRSQ
ncbi:MAG: FAD-dependent monooxygenase [Actinomycetota bacterium]|nr:FAD-dependent monooxygenase [Actinomycetota bacterium]